MRVYNLIEEMRSDLIKSQDRLHTLFNPMIPQHQTLKIKMKPKAVYSSDISLSKATSWKIFVSTDMAPDLSAGINPVQGIALVFHETSNTKPHTSHIWTHIELITYLSYDPEPEITKYNSRKVLISEIRISQTVLILDG